MNWRRGWWRVWAVATALWLVGLIWAYVTRDVERSDRYALIELCEKSYFVPYGLAENGVWNEIAPESVIEYLTAMRPLQTARHKCLSGHLESVQGGGVRLNDLAAAELWRQYSWQSQAARKRRLNEAVVYAGVGLAGPAALMAVFFVVYWVWAGFKAPAGPPAPSPNERP